MDNVTQNTVIRQLLSLLPVNVQERTAYDRYAKKLTINKSILLFAAASMDYWSSYEDMGVKLRSKPELQDLLQLQSISGSQLSRKLNLIPTELLQEIFIHCTSKLQRLTNGANGITANIGKLAIVDSSALSLPLNLAKWAKISRKESGIKMHTRLIAASPDAIYPDAMVPSTRNVGDREGAIELVTESDATYVMDRGYDDYKKMDRWVERNIRFVMRIRDRTSTTVLEEYEVPTGSHITRDAKVKVGSAFRSMENNVRLVEYLDEQGRTYRILTTRWDVTAEEIAQIYKCRWLIELFFKWLKQHVRLVKLYSYKPQALWNQMFIALIVHALVQLTKMSRNIPRTNWQMLQLLRTYLFQQWAELERELNRTLRKSKGRKPSTSPPEIRVHTKIGIMKPSKQ
ncbi:IS4 family transposase [Paenibacillus thermotolerans]|uniref:IS4 family transposase n=1 Tax=Paenibacillus thermotolerans TaxID=3027807 RepID=UPI0023683266|nr:MULTISPECIES: IS4 family transposase [unclassified Paenibacillus]